MFASVQGHSLQCLLPSSTNRSAGHARRCVCRSVPQQGTSESIAAAADQPPVGIDLGTTNSLIAVLHQSSPVVIPLSEGVNLLPSVVAFSDSGEVTVGAAAKRIGNTRPGSTFASVKRLIGQKAENLKSETALVAYDVGSDEEGNVQLLCEHAEDGTLYPEEVSAYVVAELLSAAEEATESQITKAVISVPAYFGPDQRDATSQAGRLAGLEVVKLIREPVAAALAYGVRAEEDEVVLVLDLGGGTFDVSILEVGGGTIEVLSTGGDAHLGGDDVDNAIVQWLARTHLQGVDWRQPAILSNLKTMAELAKIQLSEAPRVSLRLPVGGEDGKGVSVVLTRQLLEELSAPLFKRMGKAVDEACWQAGVDLGTVLEEYAADEAHSKKRRGKAGELQIRPKRRAPISQVLLVGGATRMPAFQRFVKNMTGLQPKGFTVDPDEAVALGAAILAGLYSGQLSGVMVMDIWQATLMRALAMQKLKEDSAAAKKYLGDDFDDDLPAPLDDDFDADNGDTS